MATKNKVIWSRGLFVQPQHCQQQQRYNDYVLNNRFYYQVAFSYGFHMLEIDLEALKVGRLKLIQASGFFKDGTPFDFPWQDLAPDPLDLDGSEQTVYLAIPVASDTLAEIDSAQLTLDGKPAQKDHLYRYKNYIERVRDQHTHGRDDKNITVAQLKLRLITSEDDHKQYTTLPLCRIKGKTSGGVLMLDNEFIPTCSRVAASTYLAYYAGGLAQNIDNRGKELARRIGSPDQQGIADVAEFMMLQLLNRATPLFKHFTRQDNLHPEPFYRELTQLCGELMTFTDTSRLPEGMPDYDHDNLTFTFHELIKLMNSALGIVLMPRAISLPLKQREHGIQSTDPLESDLLKSASFILAVKADMPVERLRQHVIQQFKISSGIRIRELVSVQIPGVSLIALSASPQQLPYHAGFTYFALEPNSEGWKDVLQDKTIAIHVSGDFPDLQMQFWAIRGNG